MTYPTVDHAVTTGQGLSSIVIRDADQGDHEALLALEGSAPHAGAALIQARTNFFARTDAYPMARVIIAEQAGALLGVLCVALTAVRVGGKPCQAGYMFNVRVDPSRGRRWLRHRAVANGPHAEGIGPMLMDAATQWVEEQGGRYATGLVKTSNRASMRMIGRRGWETVDRYDYLVLDLGRFTPDPTAEVRRVSVWEAPGLAATRNESVFLQHFVPQQLDLELFAPPPAGSYAGSWQGSVPDGSAWVSLWDDRRRRGLDPTRFRAVKAFDVSLEGPGGFRAFCAIAASLWDAGFRQLLMPLRLTHEGRALLAPFTEDTVEFHFVIKRLNGADALPPGPVYFDIRH